MYGQETAKNARVAAHNGPWRERRAAARCRGDAARGLGHSLGAYTPRASTDSPTRWRSRPKSGSSIASRPRASPTRLTSRWKSKISVYLSEMIEADAGYFFVVHSVRRVQIGKRQYEVYNCGPELLNVPSLNKVTRVLELQDTQIAAFLLDECKWTAWKPPASWRMKVDQVYDLTVHMAVRKHGFLTNEIRVIRMRVGRKWVGPHHHNSDLAHKVKSQWLHRVDYETQDNIETAESAFFQTIKLAWDKYLCELSRLPKEDLRSFEEMGNGFPFDEQDQHTSLRIKYLLETSLGTIMSEKGTFFRSAHQYELWRMAQEDDAKHRECFEDSFAGPLLEAGIAFSPAAVAASISVQCLL